MRCCEEDVEDLKSGRVEDLIQWYVVRCKIRPRGCKEVQTD